MEDETAVGFEATWVRAASAAGLNLPGGLHRILVGIPEPDVATVSADASALFALAGDLIFTVRAEQEGFVVEAHPLDADRLIISCERAGSEPSQGALALTTRWGFRYGDGRSNNEPWQAIEGRTIVRQPTDRAGEPDHRQAFAQAIAARVGWPVSPP